jgi:ketosteroid isomerase-like protein
MASRTAKKSKSTKSKGAGHKPQRKAASSTKSPRKAKARTVQREARPAQNHERDRREILNVSRTWWDANRKFSIPMMVDAFVGGDKFHGFNLNGHTYYGIGEWVQLWKYLARVMAPSSEASALNEPRDLRVIIRGDMAFLTAETVFKVKVLPDSPDESPMLLPGQEMEMPIRMTEVFVREDHQGKPEWKMWHFHCSPKAPPSERRMGF